MPTDAAPAPRFYWSLLRTGINLGQPHGSMTREYRKDIPSDNCSSSRKCSKSASAGCGSFGRTAVLRQLPFVSRWIQRSMLGVACGTRAMPPFERGSFFQSVQRSMSCSRHRYSSCEAMCMPHSEGTLRMRVHVWSTCQVKTQSAPLGF